MSYETGSAQKEYSGKGQTAPVTNAMKILAGESRKMFPQYYVLGSHRDAMRRIAAVFLEEEMQKKK